MNVMCCNVLYIYMVKICCVLMIDNGKRLRWINNCVLESYKVIRFFKSFCKIMINDDNEKCK